MKLNKKNKEQIENATKLQFGGAPASSHATLCIYADNLNPDFLSKIIGCKPTKARRKGEKYIDRPKIPPAKTGQWFLEAPENLPFEEKVEFLVAATTSDVDVWNQISKTYTLILDAAIYLQSWTEGFYFSNEILNQISKRHWSFDL